MDNEIKNHIERINQKITEAEATINFQNTIIQSLSSILETYKILIETYRMLTKE